MDNWTYESSSGFYNFDTGTDWQIAVRESSTTWYQVRVTEPKGDAWTVDLHNHITTLDDAKNEALRAAQREIQSVFNDASKALNHIGDAL